jgi:glycosyltransferase involved in cell wall biosynthesis
VFHITGDVLYAAFALPRRRTTLTVHDCVFLRQRSGLRRWLILKLTLAWPVRRCPRITAISEKTKREVAALTGCDPARIVVIPNPVSPLIRTVPRVFDAGCPRLLFLGITPNKNLPRAVKALQGLRVHLTVIGQPVEADRMLLSDSGIPHDIVHGLSAAEVASQYEGCDIVLFPSLYEGFGLPIVEAFQAGRPVVTSDLPPMSEVAGDAACLVDPEDVASIRAGVLRIIGDAGYRDDLVRRGLARVASHQPSAIAAAYAAFCQGILQASR